MEDLVEVFVKDLCDKNPWFEYKEQATAKFIEKEWWIELKSDKAYYLGAHYFPYFGGTVTATHDVVISIKYLD